ncbi:MAG: PIG-L family deacetylase, partial [Planctomycetota bacterium]
MDCSARTRNHRTQAGGTPAVLCGAALALLGFCCLQSAAAADMGPPFERGLELVRNELLLARSGCRAMQIVARPGGEDGAALSYLRRALGVETHLCCLTRGEGEENESGAEWGARLAVLRTRETEAACAVLGAKAWYLNLPDKGCSKSTEKTLKDWGHDRALARLVRVIRIVKPHIIFISNAADEAGGTPALPPGGGTEVLRPGAGSAGVPPAVRPESSDACYRATAQLVGEAFDAAADEAQFAEQTKTDGTGPWGVSKLYVCCGGNRPATLSLDAAEREPLSGLSAAEIAAWAAREHASLGLPPQTALQVNDKRDFALLKSRLRNTEETNLLAGLTPPPRRVTAAVDAALKQLQAAPWGELPTRPAAVGDGSPAQAIAAACAAATQEAPGEDALLGHLHAALAEAAGLRISVRSEARILTQREEASVTVTVANTGPLDATACKCELFAESTELTIADGPGEPSLPAKSVAHLTSRVSFTGNPFPSWPPENYIFDRMEARTPVRARITLHVAGAGLALTRSVPLELALPRAVAIAPDPVLVFDDPDHGDEVQGLARFRIHVTNYRRLEDAVGRLYAGIVAQGKAPVDRFATLTFRRAGETLGAEFRFMATVGQLNKGDLEVPTAVWTELANFGGPKARL